MRIAYFCKVADAASFHAYKLVLRADLWGRLKRSTDIINRLYNSLINNLYPYFQSCFSGLFKNPNNRLPFCFSCLSQKNNTDILQSCFYPYVQSLSEECLWFKENKGDFLFIKFLSAINLGALGGGKSRRNIGKHLFNKTT